MSSATGVWVAIGAILLSIGILLAVILLALYVPPLYGRILVIAIGVGVVVVLYVFGIYAEWFLPGGALNPGVG